MLGEFNKSAIYASVTARNIREVAVRKSEFVAG